MRIAAATGATNSTALPAEFLSRPRTVAHSISRFIAAQGIRRVYGLPGGHVKPLWDELDHAGVRIVSTRHEGAAVHMAQAEAELTGELGVAIVTAGPGLTNAVTGIACAELSRVPVLIVSARPPRPQAGMGALEEVPQADIVRPLTRRSLAAVEARQVVPFLDEAVAAALGDGGTPGPVYVDFPTDLMVEPGRVPFAGEEAYRRREPPLSPPDPDAIDQASALVRSSRRPLVISGAVAKRHAESLLDFVRQAGALHVDTRASKSGLWSTDEAFVPAVRGRAMAECDLVITVGRELDFEVAYGSPAAFAPDARFLRIGSSFAEVGKNRRGDVEIVADVGEALESLLNRVPVPERPDLAWRDELIARNRERIQRLRARMGAFEAGADGGMHPNFVLAALNERIDERTIVVVDGGDTLAFARVGLDAPTYLDLGPFGCLGVGVPFANAAALTNPGRPVMAVVGDGSFGFHALEIETAVREAAPVAVVVLNNSAWNIERQDQIDNYGGRIIGTELSPCDYGRLAESLGAHGERVERPEELGAALDRALANRPAVVDVVVTRDAVSPDSKSGLATVPPLQAVRAWHDAEVAWHSNPQPRGATDARSDT